MIVHGVVAKMVEKRTYIEIAIITALMVSLGVNVSTQDEGYIPYSCEKETVNDMMCYKLSRVNDVGLQRNCYYDRDNSRKYKVCSDGWERIINIDEYDVEKECPKVQTIAYTDNGKYFCSDGECIKDNTIEMPMGVI